MSEKPKVVAETVIVLWCGRVGKSGQPAEAGRMRYFVELREADGACILWDGDDLTIARREASGCAADWRAPLLDETFAWSETATPASGAANDN